MLNISKQKGFTLVEILVVLAVFSTTLLIVTDIFLNVTLSQKRILAAQKVQSELRYSLEFMAQQIRGGKIIYDYSGYGGSIDLPENFIAIKDQDNNNIVFGWFSGADCLSEVNGCVKFQINSGPWQSLTTDIVEINRLDFYINPTANPYETDPISKQYLSDEQPLVTIIIQGTSIGPAVEDRKTFNLQTSVASRYYER